MSFDLFIGGDNLLRARRDVSEVGWQELRDGTGGPSGQIRSSGVDRQPVFVTTTQTKLGSAPQLSV